VAAGLLLSGAAAAQQIELGDDFELSAKSYISQSMAWRLEPRDSRLIYKQNLNPHICQSQASGNACYSFNGDASLNRALVAAPGAYNGPNRDDGDLNYAPGSLTAALTKLNTQLSGHWGDFNFKLGALGYFDPRNYDKTEFHPDSTYQPTQTDLAQPAREQGGKSWVLTDALVNRVFKVLDHDFSLTAGWQHIRWGESTLVALNSLSEINAPDERLLFQPGTQIAEIFRPTPALLLGTPLRDNINLDLVYLFGWDPVQVAEGGTFYGPFDVYTRNGSKPGLLSLGQLHEDPYNRQPLPGIGASFSPSHGNTTVLPLGYAQRRWKQGQFGAKLSWYVPELNGGTDLSFYALRYKSRLPYLSFYAMDRTCIHDGDTDIVTAIIVDCKGGNFVPGGGNPFPLDTAKTFWDYPGNIQMYGISFNTNAGKWSLAGELSFRPNLPVQVQSQDVFMTATQPALPRLPIEISQTTFITGLAQYIANPANVQYLPIALQALSSPALLASLAQVTASPRPLIVPAIRDFAPDNLSVYRHQTIQPGQLIPGYEKLQALQLDFTGLRAFGSSENPIGADQVIIIAELGMMWFPNMPSSSRLQFETGDLGGTHASPGADGSGDRPGSTTAPDAQGNGARIIYPDGSLGSYVTERYTPTQQTSGFATPFSTGYRLIFRLEYDNFLFDWNFKPQLIWGHDLYGRSPLPQQNFIQGAKTWQLINAVEFSPQWSAQVFYQGSTGGGTVNYLRDKDTAGFGFAYSF